MKRRKTSLDNQILLIFKLLIVIVVVIKANSYAKSYCFYVNQNIAEITNNFTIVMRFIS